MRLDPERLSEGFLPLMAPFEVATLERMPAPMCGLWPDLRIGYVNPAWVAFGMANGLVDGAASCGLGANVLVVTPTVLRPFYEGVFARARDGGAPVDHDYECSSPTLHRVFRMRVHPCASGAMVIAHSLLREIAQGTTPRASADSMYRDARGLVVQCSNCRRVRRGGGGDAITGEWDWVPDFVTTMPPRTSHGLCALCVDFYYS